MIGSSALYMPLLSQSYCQIPTLIKPQAQRILGGPSDVFYKKREKKKTTGIEKFKLDDPCYLKSGVPWPTSKLTPPKEGNNYYQYSICHHCTAGIS